MKGLYIINCLEVVVSKNVGICYIYPWGNDPFSPFLQHLSHHASDSGTGTEDLWVLESFMAIYWNHISPLCVESLNQHMFFEDHLAEVGTYGASYRELWSKWLQDHFNVISNDFNTNDMTLYMRMIFFSLILFKHELSFHYYNTSFVQVIHQDTSKWTCN